MELISLMLFAQDTGRVGPTLCENMPLLWSLDPLNLVAINVALLAELALWHSEHLDTVLNERLACYCASG